MPRFTINGYTGPNPDFTFYANFTSGVPSFDAIIREVQLRGIVDGCRAAQLYANVADECCPDGENQDHLFSDRNVAVYLFYGMPCSTCHEADEADGGCGVEFGCGDEDCNPEPFMITVDPYDYDDADAE